MSTSTPRELIFQSVLTRRAILASYWTVIFLAIPLWWYTTSIERLALPSARVYAQAERELIFPVEITIEPPDAARTRDLNRIIQEKIALAPLKWHGIDLQVHDHPPKRPGAYRVVDDVDVVVGQRELLYPLKKRPLTELADLLVALIAPDSTLSDQKRRVVQYSPRYRLAFTLLNEDATAGNAVTGWEVSNAIHRRISPVLNRLSVLHNFTIESQVQFHAPLAFAPQVLQDGSHGISSEDLTVFINSADWTLSSSISNDPVLHFVIFVPSASRRPLHILDSTGKPTTSKAFLLSQWGGIVIHNPSVETVSSVHMDSVSLDPIFSAFESQLLTLLGVPPRPAGYGDKHSAITDWQLDALLRRRARENQKGSQDTLQSIIKLVGQIENMPVGQDVKSDILNALTALDNVYKSSSTSLTRTMQESATAMTLASRAFFSPGMLALLYFPAEHKYAVYTPLFASALSPLVGALFREIMAWRRNRKAKKLAEKAKAD